MECNLEYEDAAKRYLSGDLTGSQRICERILEKNPGHLRALHLQAMAYYGQSDYPKARDLLHKLISCNNSTADYHNDLGLVLMAQKHYAQALEAFEQALSLSPGVAPFHINAGLAYTGLGDDKAARTSFEKAITCDPGYAKGHFFLAKLHETKKEFESAIFHYHQAVRSKPDFLGALNNLATCLMKTGDFGQAQRLLKQALALHPDSAESACNLGNLLRLTFRFQDAVRMYERAIALKPDYSEAHFNLALVLLLLGRYARGWSEYEWRLCKYPDGSGYPNRHGLPLWRGEDISGKTLLVYDEQGFGDTFMLARYLTMAKQSGARIIFEIRPGLHQLFSGQNLADELVIREKPGKPPKNCDYCTPLPSLPGIMGTLPETIPNTIPYLAADPEKIKHWHMRIKSKGLKIGIVWSGSDADPARRCPLSEFESLSRHNCLTFYGLQKHDPDKQARAYEWLTNFGPELNDFSDTAAVLANMDLLISIDTSVAHLAGAMGRPAWVLLPYIPDWRWMPKGEKSPWYPGIRLFRQDEHRSWRSPIERIARELVAQIEKFKHIESLRTKVQHEG
ncbi:MAG: tetratricopeptide repeat protein [Desulfobacteraceae bacterium]|nr:tetratricopeptide repeat protein [Desulfobacteraceae bacterium]